MRAVKFVEPKKLIYCENVPEPTIPFENWVKIKVAAAGLCGSDIQKINSELDPKSYLATDILGHEFSGTVIETGPGVRHIKNGDRVVGNPLIHCGKCKYCLNNSYQHCVKLQSIGKHLQGAFADFLVIPEANLYKILDITSFEIASLTDVVACDIHAYNLAEQPNGQKVLVLGDGPLALIMCLILKYYKNEISICLKHENTQNIAHEFGLDVIKIEELSEEPNDSFDIIFEGIGRAQSDSIQNAVRLIKPRGKVIILGVFDFDFHGSFYFRQLFYKEAVLLGSNSYSKWTNRDEFADAMSFIENKLDKKQLEKIITHKLDLSEFNYGIDLVKGRHASNAIKVIYT